MAKLILLRHFKSQWNLENRFSGWVDVPLCRKQDKKVIETIKKISKSKIDVIYSSSLIRNQHTVLKICEQIKDYPIFYHLKGKMMKWGNFKELHKNYLPVYLSEDLNERYYGKLQGLNKIETIKKYGAKKVHLWRRDFNVSPPDGESLKDVVKRTTPFFRRYIEKDLKQGKNVLVVASHNSLRAIIKYLEKISNKDIINVEMSFAGLREYELEKGRYNQINGDRVSVN